MLPIFHQLKETDFNKLTLLGIELEESDIEPLTQEKKALQALEESVATVQHIFQDIRHSGQIPIMDIRNEIMPRSYNPPSRFTYFLC